MKKIEKLDDYSGHDTKLDMFLKINEIIFTLNTLIADREPVAPVHDGHCGFDCTHPEHAKDERIKKCQERY